MKKHISFGFVKTIFSLLLIAPAFAQSIERLDESMNSLIPKDAQVETLCTGFTWTEGPVWDESGKRVLFSDVPKNTIFQWKEGDKEASVYMKPSGFTGIVVQGREPGSNGLAFDAKGQLVLCEHGDRRISVLTKFGGKRTLCDNFEGKRLSSPNDLAIAKDGTVYFTDPAYGLPKNAPEAKELSWNGVYRVSPKGEVSLLIKDLKNPNGVALSPDDKKLFIAQSDGSAPNIYVYDIKEDGTLSEGKIFFATEGLQGGGHPDGIKINPAGNVFSTGPGGVLIISPEGKLLGRILCNTRATANLAFDYTNKYLYITSCDRLLRVKIL